jgi:hypothetical protein
MVRADAVLAAFGLLFAATAPCTCGLGTIAGLACSFAGFVVARRSRGDVRMPLASALANGLALLMTAFLALAALRVAAEAGSGAMSLVRRAAPSGFCRNYRRD